MISVSVVIAAYNAELFLERALRSALNQEGVDLEVLVIDDASGDGTAEVAKQQNDPRIRYIRLDQNSGPAAARNRGFAEATGDWIAILDADDAFEPGRLKALTQAGADQGADFVSDNFWILSERTGDRRLFLPEALDDGIERFDLATYAMANRLFISRRGTGYLKPLFRRAFVRSHSLAYDPTLRIGEDFMLVAQGLAAGAIYVRRRSAGYIYTTREGSISHRLNPTDVEAMALADERLLAEPGLISVPQDRRAIQRHLDSLRDGAAFVHLVDAIKARSISRAFSVGAKRPACLRHLAMPLQVRAYRLLAALGFAAAGEDERRSLS